MSADPAQPPGLRTVHSEAVLCSFKSGVRGSEEANAGCFKSHPFILNLSLQYVYHLWLYCRSLHVLEHFQNPVSRLLCVGKWLCDSSSTAFDLHVSDLPELQVSLTNTQNNCFCFTPVSSLESTIPLLLGKLSSLENRRNKNATVSENIVRIRQLITQARNAASKVGLWVPGVWGEWGLTWGCCVNGRGI